jgi:hypothetical protein
MLRAGEEGDEEIGGAAEEWTWKNPVRELREVTDNGAM